MPKMFSQRVPEVKVIFTIIVRYLPFSRNLMNVMWSFPQVTSMCYHNILNAEAALRNQLLCSQTVRRRAKIQEQCHTFHSSFFVWGIMVIFS